MTYIGLSWIYWEREATFLRAFIVFYRLFLGSLSLVGGLVFRTDFRLCSLPLNLLIRSNGILGYQKPVFTSLIRINISQAHGHLILTGMRYFSMKKICVGIDIAKLTFVAAVQDIDKNKVN